MITVTKGVIRDN